MKMLKVAGAVMTGVLTLAPIVANAQGARTSVTAGNSSGLATASPEMVSLTVHEAWVQSGRNEDKFFDMVKQFAQMSAAKRGISLPDSEAAGVKMGNLIKTSARRDPDQLLYAVVDAAVRQTARGTQTASAK